MKPVAHYALVVVGSLLVTAPAASAEEATPAAQAGDPERGLEEVVVTAQRREENSQRAALAITAVSGNGLAEAGVHSITDITRQVPNVQINSDSGGTTLLTIRGIGSTDVTEAGDSAVAVNLDGVYVARNTSISGLFYDINRVEVLRGPQGTLYGRSATAGAINVISNRPTFESEAAASVEFGNFDTLSTSGMINVPLSDAVAARAAFQTRRHDGYADNGNGLHTMDQDDVAGRGQLLMQPFERLNVLVGIDYYHAGGVGGGFRGLQREYPFGSDPYKFPLTAPNFRRDQKDWGVRGEVNYDLDFATLTYLGSERWTDADLIGQAPLFNTPYRLTNDQKQYSHELRLGGSSGPFTWVVGGNYFREYSDVKFLVDLGGGAALNFVKPDVGARSKAAFGQSTFTVAPGIRLTAGVRYTSDSKYSFDGSNTLVLADGTPILIASQNVAVDSTRTTWRIGADFDVGPQSIAYASVATGYKPGGYFDGDAPNTYSPEDIKAYEIGSKNRFFSDRLQLNVAGFYYDYSDFQVSGTRQLNGTFAGIILNAQSARVFGAEIESIFLATANDQFDLSIGWLDAHYERFFLPDGDAYTNFGLPVGAPTRPLLLDDNRLAKAPQFTVNAGYKHDFPLKNGGKLVGTLYSHFETAQNLEYHGYPITRVSSFSRTDLTFGYEAPKKQWYVTGYVRNIEDDAIPTAGTLDFATNNPDRAAASLSDPRTYGVILGTRF